MLDGLTPLVVVAVLIAVALAVAAGGASARLLLRAARDEPAKARSGHRD